MKLCFINSEVLIRIELSTLIFRIGYREDESKAYLKY